MITAHVESFRDGLDELMPLLPGHWHKLALNKDTVPLDPQFDVYFAREDNGELIYIALREAGKLIGYWIAFIAPGLHYKTLLTATMDIWNIIPGYERTNAMLVLMRAVEREYNRRRGNGQLRSFAGEKLHNPCGRLFRAFGYSPVETYYSKMYGG